MTRTAAVLLAMLALALAGCTSPPAREPPIVPGPSAAIPTPDPQEAFNRLYGTGGLPSAFSSYHIEVKLDMPAPGEDGTSLVIERTKLSADVQGRKVLATFAYPREPLVAGFVSDYQEYRRENGKLQAGGPGPVAVRWATWPLDVVPVFSDSVLLAHPSGTEVLEGRPVDVYSVNTAYAPGDQARLSAPGSAFHLLQGQIWVDRQTGGLLLIHMDFKVDVPGPRGGAILGTENGHLDLVVSQIDRVQVNLP